MWVQIIYIRGIIMDIRIVDYNPIYANMLSQIIIRNLMEINSKDYSLEEMEQHSLHFSPEKISEYALERKIYVAIEDDYPIGTLGIKKDERGAENDYVFLTVFVLPEKHKSGIGRLLIKQGEEYVNELGGKKITIPASITSHAFYRNMGYVYAGKEMKPNQDGIILMIKELT